MGIFFSFFVVFEIFIIRMYYDTFGDKMNSLEINIIFNKMLNKTKVIDRRLKIEKLKQVLIIDKNPK